MTSSNRNIFRVTGRLCGEFSGHQWIPHTKASDAELCCFFDLCLNKRLSKQSWGWWFETPSRSLWRHCNEDHCSSNYRQITCPIKSRNIEMITHILLAVVSDDILAQRRYIWYHRSLLTIVVVHWKQFSVQSVATISSRFWNEKVVILIRFGVTKRSQ